jgi:hypothetical protein
VIDRDGSPLSIASGVEKGDRGRIRMQQAEYEKERQNS